MKKKTLFNVGILTFTNIFVRFAGMLYKIWLAKNISPLSLGIYQLATSVYGFFITPVASGLPSAVNRLCAKHSTSAENVLYCALRTAVIPLAFSVGIIFFGRDIISNLILHTPDGSLTAVALIPAVALGGLSVLPASYLHAKGRSAVPAFIEIAEQSSKILFAVVLVRVFSDFFGNEQSLIPVLSLSFGSAVSFLLSFKFVKFTGEKGRFYGELAQNAIPPTFARIVTSLLHLANVSVLPVCLAKYGYGSEEAVSLYGILSSMAYPIVFIPMTAISAVCTVYLPEIAKNLNDFKVIKSKFTRYLLSVTVLSGIFCIGLLLFAPYFCLKFFGNGESGHFAVLLIPCALFCGMKQICSATLNGLGRQKWVAVLSIADGTLGLLLTLLLAGKYGIYGFIAGNCVQDLIAFALSFALCVKFIKKGEIK